MESIFPASFWTLALAHFLALVSPGPDFFLVAGHAARHRLRGTVFICAGIALGNIVYIAAAIFGWSAIRQSPFIYKSLEIAGALYLIWMGCMLIRASQKPAAVKAGAAAPLSPVRQLCVGLGSALLNPKNAVFYLTLMTVIIGAEATVTQQIFSGAWMASLVFAWDSAVAAAIAHSRAQKVLGRRISYIESAAGFFLILLAFAFVFVPAITAVDF